MKINCMLELKSISGRPFMFPAPEGQQPKAVRLGDVLLEAALVTPTQIGMNGQPQPIPQSAAQMVARHRLGEKIHAALEAEETETAFTLAELTALKDRLPLLEVQKGFSGQLIAAALLAAFPDDFPVAVDG